MYCNTFYSFYIPEGFVIYEAYLVKWNVLDAIIKFLKLL
jgi:hypothetical protein